VVADSRLDDRFVPTTTPKIDEEGRCHVSRVNPVDLMVRDVLDAVERRDWDVVRALLHPYLHWQEAGVAIRGRRNVLDRLALPPAPTPASAVELRDGQIYRWTSTGAPDGG
jgi:hypothetical protein